MWGSLISGGLGLLGSLFGSNKQEKMMRQQMAMQQQFAQNGIQWKVADAKAAGIHPLAALGAQTHSYTPQSIGGDSFGTGMAQFGQDLGRAIDSRRSEGDRITAIGKTQADLSTKRMKLENDLLSAQIAKIKQPANAPSFPALTDNAIIPGQGQTKRPLLDLPVERSGRQPSSSDPGPLNTRAFIDTGTGMMPVMSSDAKSRLEEDLLGTVIWNLRNRVRPMFGKKYEDPPRDGRKYDYVKPAMEYRTRGSGGW